MESESSFIARQLRYFTAIIYAQIKLSTRDGLTDLAKNQEISLLPLINLAYGADFRDLNAVQRNYPSFDYGSFSTKTGLQMTATVTKKKFQDTVNTHNGNPTLKKDYPNILFFLLTVEPVSSSVKLSAPNINYITLFDMVSVVIQKDTQFQKHFLSILKSEHSQYFSSYSAQSNTFSLPARIPVPTDLMLFNESVSTQEFFPDNPGDGYLKVFDLINNFHKQLSKCTYKARELLVSMIKIASPPTFQNEKIAVYADEVLGSLDINEENFSSFEYHYNLLKVNDLVEKFDEYQGMYTRGDDVYMDNRAKLELNYWISEPEMNLFSALLIFYLNRHNINDFENAFLNCDFSKLSDSLC
ncbi:SMEK domain-containing protein [Xenorhabdus sp. KJ12.1]|uniref:SMEK domain-containing protein n=1 Tax=Xenorhabdus sp. KJ12.1 TaxID=1851571 RepID=UPI000C0438EA|nr:SMEK domain-containing protein [Xenorhabdus sp. KJ12.1]PHM70598.1 hypothetical protein Xekj_01847 [Xenorhabdus sp. KJ12.1]